VGAPPAIAAAPPPGPAATRGLLGIRRAAVDLGLPAAAAERARQGEAAAPREPPARPSGRLEPAAGGAVIHDRVATIAVAPDGSARIEDAPNLEAHVPIPSPRALGRAILRWYEDPYAQTRVGGEADLPEHARALPIAPDRRDAPAPPGKVSGGAIAAQIAVGLAAPRAFGTMDLTDWIMRAAGAGDPYAARKLALLDATRAERLERGRAFRAEELARAGELMRGNLDALARTSLPAAERRAAVFALWDDCAEDDGPLGDSGAVARAVVRGYIAVRFPPGGPDAFTAEEIAAFDARRRSRQHFAPYAPR
jgi:hypothetical protein